VYFKKFKRNFRKNVRAISPVIATLLMIAIAVVASLVVYAWVMGYMSFTTSKTGKAITIQSVSAPAGSTQMDIYVQNVGDSSVTFVTGSCLYVNGAITGSSATPSPLTAGSTAKITTTLNPAAASGAVYNIKVTTQDGTFNQMTYTVP